MKRTMTIFFAGFFLAACDSGGGTSGSQGGGSTQSTSTGTGGTGGSQSTSTGTGGTGGSQSTSTGTGGTGGSQSTSTGTGGTGGTTGFACGNLDHNCGDSEYCLVSSMPESGGTDLIMTSECQPFPPPGCSLSGTQDEICACLVDDAVAKNSNCAKLGASFSCHIQRDNGEILPGVELTCRFVSSSVHAGEQPRAR